MSRREELQRRCDAAMTAAAEKAESISEWSAETRMAVAMTIRLLGREFSRTLELALACANEEIDPISPARLAEVERDWKYLIR